MSGEALLVLSAIDQVQGFHAIRPVVLEWHSSALLESDRHPRCDAKQNGRHAKQSAHEVIGPLRRQQESMLIWQARYVSAVGSYSKYPAHTIPFSHSST